jgi:hypothetical protein
MEWTYFSAPLFISENNNALPNRWAAQRLLLQVSSP